MTLSWCLLAYYPIADIAGAVFWLWSSARAWSGYTPPTTEDSPEERALGASVIMGQLGAVITGASVILAGVGAFVALESSPIGPLQSYHLFFSALWAVCGLGLAMYMMGTLPTRTPKENFVRSKEVAIPASMSLYFSLAAGVRFVLSVRETLLL